MLGAAAAALGVGAGVAPATPMTPYASLSKAEKEERLNLAYEACTVQPSDGGKLICLSPPPRAFYGNIPTDQTLRDRVLNPVALESFLRYGVQDGILG